MKRTRLYLLFILLIASCTGETSVDTLELALETSPNKLDPAFVVDVAEGQISSLIFQGLVRFSPNGEVIADAAASWELSADGLRYTFRLRDDLAFSDGTPLRAAHVIASFERVLSPDGLSPRRWVLDRVAGAKAYSDGAADNVSGLSAPDETTVVIELEAAFRPFLQMLAMPAAYIVPVEAVDAVGADAFASRPVGSGRWQLVDWVRGDYLQLDPNPHYPGPPPALSSLRFRIIPEAFTRTAEYEAGTLDILKVPDSELDRFLNDNARRRELQSQPELRVLYVGLNNGRGPLQDVRVRRALNMAVDVDKLIEVLTQGQGVRAKGAIPPTLPGFAQRDGYDYDPQAAKALLKEAGYSDGFAIEIWLRDSPIGSRVVEAVQGYLLAVDIEVTIVKREWSAFKEAVSQGRVDAFFLDWWADYPDAENFLFPLFHSANAGGGGNRAFVRNADVDALIEAAQRTPDAQAGVRMYTEADQLIYDMAPWIYLYFPTTFVAVSPAVKDYVFPTLYLGEDFSSVRKTGEGG